MRCRQCGTEIAEKALICYRCGTATTEPQFKPHDTGRRKPGGLAGTIPYALVVLIVLALAAGTDRIFSDTPARLSSWVVAAIVIALVAWRAIRRRR